MPHICTRCNNVFDSGEDILKGCPACGWKKFMFVKNKPGERAEGVQEQIINQAMGVKRPPKRPERSPTKSSPTLGVADYGRDRGSHEGSSDRSASAKQEKPTPAKAAPPSEAKALESVKITGPGTYELNLPSLFERDELIMAVKEGTYFIDLTSAFRKGKKD